MDHHHNGIAPGLAAPASGTSNHRPPLGTAGPAPASVGQSETASVASAGRFEGQDKQDSLDFRTAGTERKSAAAKTAAERRKATFTMVARCALLGVSLSLIEDDAGRPLFIASQGAWTRDLRSIEEVDAFLRRLGGPKA